MSADTPEWYETITGPPAVGFRPGEDLVRGDRPGGPGMAEPVEEAGPSTLVFTQAADAGGTDFDVLMGYQMFLGRDPESSFVIADAKSSPVGAFIRALMSSGEFQSAVLDRLAAGRPLPHESASLAPSPEQLDWLFRHLRVPPRAEAALRRAPDWRSHIGILVAVPGFPHAPERAAQQSAEAGPATRAADDGFVLVHLEQPKAGERINPGALVTGAGWAIAPADVAEVSVHLDETLLTHARYGLPRPDVARNFPHYRHVDHCGFTFTTEIPAAAKLHPASQLVVTVRTVRGETGRKAVRLQPPSATERVAQPAGEAWPIRLVIEEVTVDADRMLRIRGWAVTQAALQSVTVLMGEAALDLPQTGMPRPDIGHLHPEYPGSGQSGFVLVQKLPALVPSGAGFVRVQASDSAGRTRQAILPVSVPGGAADGGRGRTGAAPLPLLPSWDSATGQARDLRLEIDRPLLDADGSATPVRGALTISGWTIGRRGVASVSVFSGNGLLGQAYLGMRREDIGAAFPDFEGSLLAGYALVLPPGLLHEGEHRIRVVATAAGEGSPVTVERSFGLVVERYASVQREAEIRRRVPPAEAAFGLRLLERQGYRPSFDIAVVASGDAASLAATLESLAEQAYPHWTASVVGSAGKDTPRLLAIRERAAGRVAAKAPARSSKAGKAPKPVRMAPAADANAPVFVMRLVAGDILGADALLALAAESATGRDADLIYADELRLDSSGPQPFFKPDWSPELLLSMNYLGRSWCASAELAGRAGWSPALGDYEAVLRLTEKAQRIGHVSSVLLSSGGRRDEPAAEQAALQAAIARRAVTGRVEAGLAAGTWHVRRTLPIAARAGAGRARPRVSIIIPTCSARELVRTAIKTIRATTAPARKGGQVVEIVVLDNTPARDKRARSWLRANADHVIDMPGAFNWSKFNNAGAKAATGEYLLFLNDDVEALQPDWLEAMLEVAQPRHVGVVGARLLYPDGKVQHGGQYLADSHARHAFRFADAAQPGPFGLALVAREMISVTGACQLVRAATFRALGGFEEAHSVVNNDLDFCLKSWRAGLSVVFTPHATLTHHELASRAALEDSYDEARFLGLWRNRFLAGDPYRSPRMGVDLDHYGADPEPTQLLHVGRRGPPAGEISRILAVKLDHIGDFLTALPAIRSLARRFPQARIDLLAPTATAALARDEPAIAEVIVFDFFHARSGEGKRSVEEAEFRALQARLAPSAYDLAIDLRMQPETRAVLPFTGAKFLAGYDFENRFPFLDLALVWEGDERLAAKRGHVSERLVQLVSAVEDACLGEGLPGPVPPLLPGDVPALAALPAEFLARRLVCVHPGVGNVVRQWPAAHYAALIDLLAGAGLHSVLIGGPDEAAIAEEVLRHVVAKGAAESLVGRVPLADLPQVMRACALFVGNNSGPQHIAASLGVPTIGIHSGVVDAAEWAPLGSQALAIRRQMVCGPCYLEFAADCPRGLACLTGLRPAEVFAVCRRLLA